MLPGRELPGSPFNGRRTCGLPTTLGHIGDEASGHDGAVVLKRGEMSCDGRGCMRCRVRGWMGGEARGMARKLSGGVARARLADGGAAGGRRTPVLHIVISLPPEEHAAWAYGGPAERARIRKAALAELHRRGRFWGGCYVDHDYRFAAELESMYLSPHTHVLVIGWIEYRTNAERFTEYRNKPLEVRPMRQGDQVVDRRYGRCRGVFIKHLSTPDTHDDIEFASSYTLSHSTASARRLGETAGGEHTVRWFGQLGNGRTQVVEVSRYERGELVADELVPNSGAIVPAQIASQTVWRASATDEGNDTIPRAEPHHVFTERGHAACARGLRRAAAALHRDRPGILPCLRGGGKKERARACGRSEVREGGGLLPSKTNSRGKREGERAEVRKGPLPAGPGRAGPGARKPPQDRMDGPALRHAAAPRPYAPASFFILATVAPLMLWPASTDT